MQMNKCACGCGVLVRKKFAHGRCREYIWYLEDENARLQDERDELAALIERRRCAEEPKP
jgi:hypothetical protein